MTQSYVGDDFEYIICQLQVLPDKIHNLCKALSCPKSVKGKGTGGKEDSQRKGQKDRETKRKAEKKSENTIYLAFPTYKCS